MRFLTDENNRFDDIVDVYQETVNSNGILGLYKGYLAYVIISI